MGFEPKTSPKKETLSYSPSHVVIKYHSNGSKETMENDGEYMRDEGTFRPRKKSISRRL